MVQSFYLPTICAATYGTLAVFIAIQAKQATNLILAGCCAVTSVWAASAALWLKPEMNGLQGLLDVARMLSWYGYLLHLYRRSEMGPAWQIRGFISLEIGALIVGVLAGAELIGDDSYALLSVPITLRLTIAVFELLLIENLYLNLPEHARWHVALPCVLLGGIACFDILITADAVLFHHLSIPLTSARRVVMLVIAPLLVLAAFRGQRWNEPIRLSRAAVFHSATLVLSGSVLLALALAGELLRRFNDEIGWVTELSLIFLGMLGLLLFLSSRSARSVIQRVVVHHFFADRYDYRLQWLQCIATLSGTSSNERVILPIRAIRAVADVVNSPSGSFYSFDATSRALTWTASWNMASNVGLSSDQPQLEHAIRDGIVVELIKDENDAENGLGQLGPAWLAVPLQHSIGVIGLIIIGLPRVHFRLDQEVFDLLRIVGREIATYTVEQQATEVISQTKELRSYGERFSFVAHDIKNVSSQLALLLKNAEIYISNPEFQHDMLRTVQASVQKIDLLLARLDLNASDEQAFHIAPVAHLRTLVANYKRSRDVKLTADVESGLSEVAISGTDFDTAITHLLDNAVDASADRPLEIRVEFKGLAVFIDIIDQGVGMSEDFIRDELFTPFRTGKYGGSGIGAYQARELIRRGGGRLVVTSCKGIGTTMRVVLPLLKGSDCTTVERVPLSTAGVSLG